VTALDRAIARPAPVRGFGERSPLDGLDRRSVSFADVLAQSVAAVAPSAAATTVVVLVAGVAGGATVPAMVAAGLLALLVASTINQFTKRMAATGSLYTFVSKGLGSGAALAAGAAIVVGYAFISVFALLGGAHYVTMLVRGIWPEFGGPLGVAAVLVAETAVLALVLVRGIRVSSRVALIVETISVVIILVLLVVLLAQIGPPDRSAIVPTADFTLEGFAAGAVLALTAFVGFESAATLGVEARSPLRNIPRAIVTTVLLAGGLYLLAAYTQVAGFHALGRELAATDSPVNELATAYGFSQLGVLIDLGIAASFLACAIASTTALTRVLFSLGRDGIAPRRFGAVHRRFHTPIGAIGVAVPAVAILPIAAVLAGVGVWDAMEAVIAVSAAGYIGAYALVCVAAPLFLRRIGELTIRTAVVSALSAIALGAGLVAYLVFEGVRGNPGVPLALGVGVLAAVLVAWRMRRGVASLAGIGAYDEPVASEVLGGVARGDADA
jgi:amino acid transporter